MTPLQPNPGTRDTPGGDTRRDSVALQSTALTDRRFFLLAFLPLVVVYLLTATWSIPKTDALTNTIAAWKIGTDASFTLDEHAELADAELIGRLAHIIVSDGSPVSAYPPGAALLAAPVYAVWPQDAEVLPPGHERRWDDFTVELVMPPVAPAAIVAALATALAVAIAGLTARPYVGSRVAIGGTYIYGLASGAWGVAADTLWQHGPAMLWVSLGVWLSAKNRYWLSGIAFGAAVLTRPLTAVIALAVGIAIAVRRRALGPILRVGVGSATGVIALIAYNRSVHGEASISGGYSVAIRENMVDLDLWWYIRNVAGGLFDPALGLIALSPFVAIALIGAVAARKHIPASLIGAGVGAVAYLLIQWKANRYSGGDGFVGYRYPLEALAAAAPMLFFGWRWISERRYVRTVFFVAIAYPLIIYTTFSV